MVASPTANDPLPVDLVGAGAPGTTSTDLTERLDVVRHRVAVLRRTVVAADSVVVVAVGMLLGSGHPVAALSAFGLLAVAGSHVVTAQHARSVAALRPLARGALAVVGVVSVLLALSGAGDGADAFLGAATALAALAAVRLAVRAPGLADHFGLGARRRLIVGDPEALEAAAARRPPAVRSGEVVLVVTRAEGSGAAVSVVPQDEQRRPLEVRDGPSGMVERVVRTALDASAERVTVVPGDSWQQPQLRELSWLLEGTGIDMVISTPLDGIAPHRVDVVAQEGRLMIRVGSASPRGTRALAKSLVDRLVAAVLLLLSAPVLLLVALAVRLDSPGPAVFRQVRVREHGRPFTMYKFRTMQVDAERQLEALQELSMHGAARPLFKLENDPRITRWGQVLRRTSIDELPQLVNVLKGEMSLIGPRPALPMEVELYDYAARRRLAVKPGMTGLWQVSGRSRLSWEQSIGIDLDYVDNWSPGTDAVIAMRTFRAVMARDGAY